MWSAMLVEDSPEEMILSLEKAGFHYTEISFEHSSVLLARQKDSGGKKNTGTEFRHFAESHGISVEQGHLFFPGVDLADPDPALRAGQNEAWKRELDLFEELGVKAAVLHGGGEKGVKLAWEKKKIHDVRLEALDSLLEHIRGYEVKIALETVRPLCFASDLLEVVNHSEQLGICLDTGHLNLFHGESQTDFIRNAGKKLIALHLADNHGTKDDHLFPGNGQISWEGFADALQDIGYSGLYNFEVPGERSSFPGIHELKLKYALALGRHLFG